MTIIFQTYFHFILHSEAYLLLLRILHLQHRLYMDYMVRVEEDQINEKGIFFKSVI